MTRVYSEVQADIYDEKRRRQVARAEETRAVSRFVDELPEGARVLDVPVGTGWFVPLYREKNLEVVGMDVSLPMMQRAARHGDDLVLVRASVTRIPFPDGHFDALVCVRLFHVLTEKEFPVALREMCRVTRGPLLLQIRTNPSAGIKWRGSNANHSELVFSRTLLECGREHHWSHDISTNEYGHSRLARYD